MAARPAPFQEDALRLPFTAFVVATLGLVGPGASPAAAQLRDAGEQETPTRAHLMQGLEAEQSALAAEQARGNLPEAAFALQEGALDPETYLLGPNDRLQLAIWGGAELYHQLVVPPEGGVFIPDVGVVAVSGLTLADARVRIREAVLGVFSNVQVNVILTGLRRFKVHVVGAVREPGPYAATAVTRVSELIEIAGGALELASLRRITLRHADGSTELADLVAYELTGVTDRNPRVSDGAAIVVPRRTTRVLLSGAVVNPGIYEPLEGERLSDLLESVGGFSPWADTTAVEMSTFVSASESEWRSLAYRPGDPVNDPILADGDAVFFRERPDWHRFGQAFVYGAVLAPGRHPIPVEGLPLSEVIARAGGFTPRANLAQAHVLRPAERFTPHPAPEPGAAEPTAEERTRLDELAMEAEADTVLARADFERLFVEQDAEADIVIRDGDIVQIPENRFEVRVLGLVKRPGAYPWIDGADLGDYVKAAGGYDRDADKGRVRLAPFYGAPLRDMESSDDIASGAIIHVPEKERRYWLTIARDFTAVIAGVASIVILVDRVAE